MPKSTSAQAVVVANDQFAEKSLLDQIADQVHAGPEPGRISVPRSWRSESSPWTHPPAR